MALPEIPLFLLASKFVDSFRKRMESDPVPQTPLSPPATLPAPRGTHQLLWLTREILVHGAPGIRALGISIAQVLIAVTICTITLVFVFK